MLMSDKYLTYKDLSKRWGLALNTLYQWKMRGILVPSMEINPRVIRFLESYILEFEAEHGVNHAS